VRQQCVAPESAGDAEPVRSVGQNVAQPVARPGCNETRPADPAIVGRLVKSQRDPAVQQELLASLLARGDLPAVNVFLDCAAEPHTAAAALDCLTRVPDPPVKTLLASLHGPRADRRLAAARVLGRLDQPAVSGELIAMARRGVHRQEAMVALLSSSETTARQFVADAARDINLSAALWSAQRQVQTSSPRRS
jgi:hypothetical protein